MIPQWGRGRHCCRRLNWKLLNQNQQDFKSSKKSLGMWKANWTKKDVPSQAGKLAIVTGPTGLGYETALVLAEAGASVIVAGRNETKGKHALANIKLEVPNAKASFEKVDLGSLASVTEFCRRFYFQHEELDILINNAGVMTPPTRETTSDGFELQFGTNHLSHFALTAQLLPALRRAKEPRVVNVSSKAANTWGDIHFEDLQFEKRYNAMDAYSQSKLCNILFSKELQKKSDAGGWGLLCISAHPGISKTELLSRRKYDWLSTGVSYLLPILGHSPAAAALPILYAATSPEVTPGGFYAPNGYFELKGAPATGFLSEKARDPELAKKLWDVSVSLSGVTWPEI